jgi:hypothetical protein
VSVLLGRGGPVLSVKPPISSLTAGYAFRISATLAICSRDRSHVEIGGVARERDAIEREPGVLSIGFEVSSMNAISWLSEAVERSVELEARRQRLREARHLLRLRLELGDLLVRAGERGSAATTGRCRAPASPTRARRRPLGLAVLDRGRDLPGSAASSACSFAIVSWPLSSWLFSSGAGTCRDRSPAELGAGAASCGKYFARSPSLRGYSATCGVAAADRVTASARGARRA